MPNLITAPTTPAAADRLAPAPSTGFVTPVVRELPRPAPEPPGYASIW